MNYVVKQQTFSDLTPVIQSIVKVCKIQNPEETFVPGWKWSGLVCNILGLWRISVVEKYICVQKNSKANYAESIQ